MSELISDPVRALLESGRLAHLATIAPDGHPHVSIAWAGLEGDDIVIGSMFDQPKLRNIRRDPRVTVSFETDEEAQFGMNACLVVRGHATVVEGGAPELLQRLAAVYIGPGVRYPPMDDPPPGFVTRITVEHVGGLGPWSDQSFARP